MAFNLNFKLVTMIVLGIGVAIIIATIGVFGWEARDAKSLLKHCRSSGGMISTPWGYWNFSCPKVRGLIAVYVLLIVSMIVANVIGWMICFGKMSTLMVKIMFIVFSFIAASLGICLLAIYSSKDKFESIHASGNLGIGLVALIYNLGMIAMGALFVMWNPKRDQPPTVSASGGAPVEPTSPATPTEEPVATPETFAPPSPGPA